MSTNDPSESIRRMLAPRSVAVIGATPRTDYGGRFLTSILRADHVQAYPVNPRYEELQGVRCYASVTDLPEPPDVVGIVVPQRVVLDELRKCADMGVKAAVVISAGYAERGDDRGDDRQAELGAFARSSGLRLVGPNCLGVGDPTTGVWCCSILGRVPAGDVALVSQSGAAAFGTIIPRANDLGIGLRAVVSTGNEADLEFTDFVRFFVDDDSTRVIAGFVEGFKDPRRFAEVASLAAERGKPIVLVKVGRAEAGMRAARSHTAALTGEDAVFEALFKQFGVTRVDDFDELLQVSRLFASKLPPVGRDIALVSHSGGLCSATADACGAAGIGLPPLREETRAGIESLLLGRGWASNPADISGVAMREHFEEIVGAMIAEPSVGTAVVATGGDASQVDKLLATQAAAGKPIVYLWTSNHGASTGLPELKANGVPVFYTATSLAQGLRHWFDYHEWLQRFRARDAAKPSSGDPSTVAWLAERHGPLLERESKEALAGWGVPVTQEMLARDADDAVVAAQKLGFPVVLKASAHGLLHKTEAGGVAVGLRDESEVREAFVQIMGRVVELVTPDAIDGILVSEMAQPGVEAIVGVKTDPQVGPVLMVGIGGVNVEIYRDVARRLCPIGLEDAHEMIDELRGVALLKGARGRPVCDVGALARVLVQVSDMAVELGSGLVELDVNPILVHAEGQGVTAVDALAILW